MLKLSSGSAGRLPVARFAEGVRQMASVYVRFSRWRRKGVWETVHAVADETEIKHVLIDSTIVRAHQHSSGARKKTVRKRSVAREMD
ncbi:transposase [Paraburkholderia atlantica]